MSSFRKNARSVARSLAAAALLAGISGYADAESIPIINAGFEEGFEADDSNETGSWTYDIFGWGISGGLAGVLQPSTVIYPSVPEGDNVAWSDGGTIFEQVTGASYQSGLTYTLSVEIGERLDVNFPGGTIGLFADNMSNIVKTLDLTDPGPGMSGEFTTQILTLTADDVALAGVVGDAIGIFLEGDDTQVNFDDVQLSAVPLPPAIWLFGSTLIGLFGLGRLERNPARA